MTQKVLITGGAGFIGSHIVDACIVRGYDVQVIDDFSSGKPENVPGISVVSHKIEWTNQIVSFVMSYKPDVICHQAAQPSLRRSIDDPVFDAEVNILGTLNVIKSAKRVGAHLIFASTSAVYDPNGELPYRESDCVKPHLPYGIAKATAERYIQDSGVSYTILRYGNVYGPRQIPVGENQLIPHCFNNFIYHDPFVINGDGMQTRDFVYVGDIAIANLMAMDKKPQGIFNCATGIPKSVNDVCESILAMFYFEGEDNIDRENMKLRFEYGPAKDGEVKHSLLDSSKAFETFGWKANVSLEDGLRKTYEWAKTQ